MRPKHLPARDAVYAGLVRRYHEDDAFAELVRAFAEGLGISMLAVTQQSGAVPAPREESPFELKIDEYARRTALGNRGVDKMLHGLAHLAVAALSFPRPDDLANPAYVGYVAVAEVDAVLRDACAVLERRAVEAEENQDALDTAPELERAWRAYTRRPAAASTKDGRLAPDTTRAIITKALRFLTDQGFLVFRNAEDGGSYRTTPRYQEQVREVAASAAFRELLDLEVVSITDPSGSLAVVAEPASVDGADV
ncbi:hypothetical protein [Amycolatopsis sp. NPDC051371]|uniref:hypothetical protein n=1 Tax=Amycolatopsis sp. NPDC051371 TaxID=3155800 RepID=UPI00342555BE